MGNHIFGRNKTFVSVSHVLLMSKEKGLLKTKEVKVVGCVSLHVKKKKKLKINRAPKEDEMSWNAKNRYC